MTTGQKICDLCMEWHLHAIEFLGGAVPRGCQECGISFETMRECLQNAEVRMYVVPKDGIYQLLCVSCVEKYMPKKRDLYAGTWFGDKVLNIR